MTQKFDIDVLKERYGDRLYTVALEIEVDDETTEQRTYIFRRPAAVSYDRMIKTMSASPSKSLRDFVMDNIIDEQRDTLRADLEDYPALTQPIADKLTSMLGLSRSANVKKL